MTNHRGYAILGAPRTGSNILCEVLTDSGRAGNPDEWYGPSRLHQRLVDWGLAQADSSPTMPRATSWYDYRQRLLSETSAGGVFGLKLFHYQARPLLRSGQLDSLSDFLPEQCRADLKVILMRRDDIVAQAVSVAVAHNTGVYLAGHRPVRTTRRFWEQDTEDDAAAQVLLRSQEHDYAPEWIDRIVAGLRAEYRAWDDWLSGQDLPVLTISYEDMVQRRSATLERVWDHLELGRRSEFPPPRISKQGDSLNASIAERYTSWLGGTSR
ncbi:Stf0 family sulfotransferase [Kitasatospora azatica]|uniref:Stf0 family sulfotransferase n=1 Tax=Kitasatospora azatica TaxID=58347 RepID=UPI000559C1CA|nr:Stf0 family sulfotransferase [Kitasatospora azatica]